MKMPGGSAGVLLAAGIFFFILGMFLEPGAIIFFAVPIVAPILARLGYDPLWVGLAFNVLLQCGYLSPPFGFSLFYLKGVTPPDVRITEIYKASVPFLALQAVALVIIVLFPSLVLWLPRVVLGY
jgi:TRAP-type mannitol/chloroaromatic compound transport system permease large subunit